VTTTFLYIRSLHGPYRTGTEGDVRILGWPLKKVFKNISGYFRAHKRFHKTKFRTKMKKIHFISHRFKRIPSHSQNNGTICLHISKLHTQFFHLTVHSFNIFCFTYFRLRQWLNDSVAWFWHLQTTKISIFITLSKNIGHNWMLADVDNILYIWKFSPNWFNYD
jgi:hypothetical protein